MYNTAYTRLWKPQRQPTIGSGGTHKRKDNFEDNNFI